jgi:hypothetical protein
MSNRHPSGDVIEAVQCKRLKMKYNSDLHLDSTSGLDEILK